MSKVISFRINTEEIQKIQENATRHGNSSVSEFARDASVNFMHYLVQAYNQGITDVKNGRIKN